MQPRAIKFPLLLKSCMGKCILCSSNTQQVSFFNIFFYVHTYTHSEVVAETPEEAEIIRVTRRLINSIADRDFPEYWYAI